VVLSDFAIIFSTEDDNRLTSILSHSIREHMPDIDVYCGLFTNNTPDEFTLRYLESKDVQLVYDKQFVLDDICSDHLFLRGYTKKYFGELLLGQYDYLLYVDIDVIFLKRFEQVIDDNTVTAHPLPEWVKKYEGLTNNNIYYNWIDIITKDNVHLHDFDYHPSMGIKEYDIQVSKRIDDSDFLIKTKLNNTVNTCLDTLDSDTVAFHYDELDEDGTFYRLEESHPQVFTKYKTTHDRKFLIWKTCVNANC